MFASVTTPPTRPSVLIGEAALEIIASEAMRSLDGLETGGILLGVEAEHVLEVRHAGDPGPLARRSERGFLRDLSHARELAEKSWRADGSQWIGEWHTHPAGPLVPSDVDLSTYSRHLHDPELDFDRFLTIIAGFGNLGQVLVTAWIATREGTFQVEVAKIPGNDQ